MVIDWMCVNHNSLSEYNLNPQWIVFDVMVNEYEPDFVFSLGKIENPNSASE
jgi:hypothetical protein